MYKIYCIYTFQNSDNSYTVSRDENWVPRLVTNLLTLAEAKQYVIEKSRLVTDLPLFLVNMDNSKKDAFIEQFCFDDDKYLKYRRFFIGYPPIDKIKDALKKDGVKIL